jgi:hypothetical protein
LSGHFCCYHYQKCPASAGAYDVGVNEVLADVAPEPEPSDIVLTLGLLGGLCLLFVAAIVIVIVLVVRRNRQ